MATDKKVLLVFTNMDSAAISNSQLPAIKKMAQKCSIAPLSVQKNLKEEAGSGACRGQSLWDAAKAEGYIIEPLDEGGELWVADIDNEADLDKALASAMEAGGNKLLAAILNDREGIFYGYGIERGKKLDKPLAAASVAPTLAFLADLPFPAQVEAPLAYPLLKGLNFKLKQIRKLADANAAMLTAMERESRKPWDKHDCA